MAGKGTAAAIKVSVGVVNVVCVSATAPSVVTNLNSVAPVKLLPSILIVTVWSAVPIAGDTLVTSGKGVGAAATV